MGRFMVAALILGGALTGCRSMEDYRRERETNAAKAMQVALSRRLPAGKVLTLRDCIGLALKNNLDVAAGRLQEKIDRERRNAEILGMLPDLLVTNDWSMRSNRPASSSQSITTGGATYNYSQSSEKYDNILKLELAFSVLDFGLAYFSSSQAQDRHLLNLQQQRRMEQNLALDVARAYFRVSAAQQAAEAAAELLRKCASIEADLTAIAESHEVSPLRIFDEHRRFIQIEQRLLAFQRNYEDGKIELLSLMGMLPSGDLRLDVSALDKLPEPDLPSVESLEKIALLERPELYTMDMQAHLILTEARKTLLLMLPNVRIFADFTNSSNQFLYHSSWFELGVRAAYNLLRLPQQIVRYRALDGEYEQMRVRELALAVGVLSQVRIAYAQLAETRRRFLLDERNLKIFDRHLARAEAGGAATREMLSRLELDRLRVETAESRIQRTVTLAEYLTAYYRLMNASGVDTLDRPAIEKMARNFPSGPETKKKP